MTPSIVKVFTADTLVPPEWRDLPSPSSSFNPAIMRFDGSLLMAYRLVLSDHVRRMALCRLDERLGIVPGSLAPLSDAIHVDRWQADPRFCSAGGRLFLHFNNGFKRANSIFLVELSPQTLLPLAPARPLALLGERREVEKNWMLFSGGSGELYAVYQIAPHIVLRLDPDASGPSIPCTPVSVTPWDASRYAERFGMLRGGTPPVLIENIYFTFFHSVYSLPRWHQLINRLRYGRGVRTRRYAIGLYGFAADYPFQPVCFSPAPLFPAPPRTGSPEAQLNRAADRVIYPSGAVYDSGEWLLSYGLHDECCCLARFSHDELLRKTTPIKE